MTLSFVISINYFQVKSEESFFKRKIFYLEKADEIICRHGNSKKYNRYVLDWINFSQEPLLVDVLLSRKKTMHNKCL